MYEKMGLIFLPWNEHFHISAGKLRLYLWQQIFLNTIKESLGTFYHVAPNTLKMEGVLCILVLMKIYGDILDKINIEWSGLNRNIIKKFILLPILLEENAYSIRFPYKRSCI
jgi:hypothetical protein